MKSWIVALQLKASDQDNVLDMLVETEMPSSSGAATSSTGPQGPEKHSTGEPVFKVKHFI